ncbi:MAG TPA: hypothetical protein VJ949_02895 [Cryomorphaceae bacterium]|nr:hypothetical protein [Cryomorphaceae bacterium]
MKNSFVEAVWISEEKPDSTDSDTTINHQPSTINHRPSTINHRLSTIDHRLSTIDYQLSTIDYRLSTIGYYPQPYRFSVIVIFSTPP